jgi:preprotein translocase subunit YajC
MFLMFFFFCNEPQNQRHKQTSQRKKKINSEKKMVRQKKISVRKSGTQEILD